MKASTAACPICRQFEGGDADKDESAGPGRWTPSLPLAELMQKAQLNAESESSDLRVFLVILGDRLT